MVGLRSDAVTATGTNAAAAHAAATGAVGGESTDGSTHVS